ncbi:MAG: signal peptide peptidase SppA [Alphaproteobacteria bacterium]|nr:signal peptide peptidase SppA [Alphaproteobacteria bacterium]
MKQFFSNFFASLLALFTFFGLLCIIVISIIMVVVSSDSDSKARINKKSILEIDLSRSYVENKTVDNPWNELFKGSIHEYPNLFSLIQLIKQSAKDSLISGIYLKCSYNANGRAASEEIRTALVEFKKTGKPIIAYGETITESAYFIANVANKIYTNPAGGLSWDGYATSVMFVKDLLDKLEIEPQIFYAGKFKSFTEPFRLNKMSEENKHQMSVLINHSYQQLLTTSSESRQIDTATLKFLADSGKIQSAYDALNNGLVDGLIYESQLNDMFIKSMRLKTTQELHFVKPNFYYSAHPEVLGTGSHKIALVYMDGDIVDGEGDNNEVGGYKYSILLRDLIKEIQDEGKIKAVIIRVNSPGGSARASEIIAHEIRDLKKLVPVVVSMGNVAASGGYYVACLADRIVAEKTTITGSIGVFTIIPNAEKFFKNKLGISFDGVSTNPNNSGLTITHPLNNFEKKIISNGVDTIYERFKQRVSEGRKLSLMEVEEIAQGRVWSGETAIEIGLVDKIGGLDIAIQYALDLAKFKQPYSIETYPKKEDYFDNLITTLESSSRNYFLKKELGTTHFETYLFLKNLENEFNKPMMKLPFMIKNNN